MAYLAHSARPDQDIPAQDYADHVCASRRLARQNADECGHYSPRYGEILAVAAFLAGEFHDLGKLDDANQAVLESMGKGKLPVPHVDAGAAHLLTLKSQAAMYGALICYAHHRGLPSLPKEINRGKHWMRDWSPEWRAHTDTHLAEYIKRHRQCVEPDQWAEPGQLEGGELQLLWRLALSCQADADHGDTARHYGEGQTPPALLKADERLRALDRYVTELSGRNRSTPRTALRREIYEACCKADTHPSFYACDAPVGSGKTTAVMAHLFKAAIQKRLRRIFVVLPYTNIISQAVDVYRAALVLDGENPEEIVAEHHHKANYASPDSRRFAILWQAPIVVTTAVQFFETLASNMPGDLRKLHHLPGSAVFLDEAHAALPPHLWPQAWFWLRKLSQDWGCHFVLASGSLTRFWELPDFHPRNPQGYTPPMLPELVGQQLRVYALKREHARVTYKTNPEALDLDRLATWVNQWEGSRLLVMNTVQSAAAVAREMAGRYGAGRVEHLSTALAPADRAIVLNRIKQRLTSSSDSDWTLVATSCIEAGVDLSFRVGFRERASLMGLIQLGGRVNRGHEQDRADVWDFQIVPGNLLRLHPKFEVAAHVLGALFREGKVAPEYCKEALKREIRNLAVVQEIDALLRAESAEDARGTDFPKVAELFNVIDSRTVTVLVAAHLQERLRRGQWCGREDLQKHSVQIWGWRVQQLGLEEFSAFPGVYAWPLSYDSFLGVMAGLLPVIEFATGKPTVI